MPARPRLTPAMADVRRAVRDALACAFPLAASRVTRDPSCGAPGGWVVPADAPRVLVALSGGPDSLALAAATAFEATKCGVRAGAAVIDHGLQADSHAVAERAAETARALGLQPVVVERVSVTKTAAGPEADARSARYSALEQICQTQGAQALLVGHSLDDQAETVLLGLARGSGARSLSGMSVITHRDSGLILLRPLLGIRRTTLQKSCTDQGLTPWDDPHNDDLSFARVRARLAVLPVLERELGPGIVESLARTATQLALDADTLDAQATREWERMRERCWPDLDVEQAASLEPAIRTRLVAMWLRESGVDALTWTHIESVDALITDWHGQAGVDIPGCRVEREAHRLRRKLT